MALVGLTEIARRQEKPLLAARLFGMTERFAQRLKPIEDRWKEDEHRFYFDSICVHP